MATIFSSMFSPEILVLFLAFYSYSEASVSASNIFIFNGNITDKLSLLAFKAQITTDPFGILNSWNNSAHFCQWHGVTCSCHGRVIALDLSSNQLAGGLNPHIGNLSFLKILNLENNTLSRTIPQELGFLGRLQILKLTNNSFSGGIPSNISHCTHLQILDLGGNNLSGKLSWELGLLLKLQTFRFDKNNISGELPSSLGNLSSLCNISGTLNSLSGAIPDSFGQLKKLSFLALGGNYLSGAIPSSFYNLSSLRGFSVSINHLEGTLPPNLGHLLPNLEIFKVARNQLSGTIPTSISNASKLSSIQFSTNSFSGKVPSLMGLSNLIVATFDKNNLGNSEDNDLNFLVDLVNCSKLEVVVISDNNFRGMLPKCISNFSTSLRKVGFGRNQIHGSIPDGIGNLIGLEAFGMESNHLIGTIPSSIGNLPKLVSLFLNINRLSGSIPDSLGNLTTLLRINLRLNNLQGRIPASVGKWRNLLNVYLSQNKLTGTIPKEIMSISSIQVDLYLSDNLLTGTIPLEVGKLLNLGNLGLSNNRLSGEIPETLGNCISLESLQLQGNMLQGTIPESLNSIKAIEILDLSCNNLSGKIPEFLGGLRLLQNLNLSFNDFEGNVPREGVFKNGTAVSLIGNKKLCGGVSILKLPSCNTRVDKSKQRTIIITVSLGLLLALLFLSSFAYYRSRKTRRRATAASASSLGVSFPKIAYDDLFKATNGFSSENLLGVGSFGSVFKGILHQSDNVVAVKVLNLRQKGALKSFMAECEALKSIKHRNLVKILTVCSSIDFSGNDFKALVYEFIANGSLEEWLHPSTTNHHQSQQLNLIQRLNVAVDIASAVDYLHNQCLQPIVHYDLKPSNVLLHSDLTACVGDFGLAKFLPEASFQIQSTSTGFKGSIGYAAPEYAMGSQVSTHGDVYSFGILLLEMFTGKRPNDELFEDNFNLQKYVAMALPLEVTEILDPMLLREHKQTNYNSNSMECMVSVLMIGVACSAESPRERMNISDATIELHRIKWNLLQCRTQQG